MPKSRYSEASSEETAFLDRQDELRLINEHVSTLYGNPRHLRVFEVLGLGGMGKTKLLEELWTDALERRTPDHLVWVSLEGEGFTTAAGPLLRMRDQLELECVLFDTALIAYWHAMGQPLQLERSGRLARSLPVKALELGGGFAGFSLPLGFGIEVFKSLKRAAAKWSHHTSEEFEEIERLHKRPRELLNRLPHYLGLDLRRRIELSGEWLVAFYDAYDRQGLATRRENAPWMQEFIATLHQGVHVVSTRESLGWEKSEWGDFLDEVPIEALPCRDAREMIQGQLGCLRQEIEDRLIEASRRTPFVLNTVIKSYADLAKRGEPIEVDELPSSPDAAVAHFLEHLPEAQGELAIALAAVQVFDEKLFQQIVKTLNIQVSLSSFESFQSWYFVEKTSLDLHKTHDILTAFVRESEPHEAIRVAALEAATEDILARCLGAKSVNSDQVLPILGAVLAGWASIEEAPTSSIEALVDAALLLYDAGYWNELAAAGSEGVGKDWTPVAAVSDFLVALTTRRIVGVEAALDRFRELMPRADQLGRHELSVELEGAYVKGLAGDYEQARKDFGRLAAQADPFDPSDRTQLRSRMYQGGMLMMDGSFEQSSRLALETYEAVDPEATADWGELVRFRGHAHRFSFMLDGAERLYLRAMDSTKENRAPALLGRLQTNLAETYCWYKPMAALGAADSAAEVNLGLNNQIELAKCAAARGIALARLEEFDKARQAVAASVNAAEEVGYPAGVAFALQAGVVAEWLAGSYDAAEATNERLASVVGSLGTYAHLQAVPFLLLGDDAGLDRVLSGAEWLDADEVTARIAEYLDL